MGIAGIVAGGLAGVAAGISARVAMRAVALSEEAPLARIQNPDGELVPSPVPILTLEGTMAVVVPVAFVGLFLGLVFTLLRLFLLRRATPSQRAALYSGLMLILIGWPFYLSTSEFEIGSRAVGVISFALCFVVFAFVFEAIMTTTESRFPRLHGNVQTD